MKKSKILILGLIAGIFALVPLAGCAPIEGSGEETSIWPMLIFLAVIFAMFYFLMIRPQRKRQKEQQQMVQELKRGDRIITIGGIYGQIESVSEDSVVIKVDSGATIRMSKGSVGVRQER